MPSGYDIIGDIHGHADRLKKLLIKLGYRMRHGIYAHPHRRAVFLGDFIDRGPDIRGVLELVQPMVLCGSAHSVIGNHEFNALAYNTHFDGNGWLREHSESNYQQHRETLIQIACPSPTEWQRWLKWFATLPLSLELSGIRIVHAAWNKKAVEFYRDKQSITKELLISMVDSNSMAGMCRELLLSGIKIALPKGHGYLGKSGFMRHSIRIKWWVEVRCKTYSELALPCTDAIPDTQIPSELLPKNQESYSQSEPPVFFGHYWLPADMSPTPLASNIACLDYSVAKGGSLVAYRWSGEQRLKKENFVVA
jgi:hypothetical protein